VNKTPCGAIRADNLMAPDGQFRRIEREFESGTISHMLRH